MPLPLFNIEIRTTAEGGPLARSRSGKSGSEGKKAISTLTLALSRQRARGLMIFFPSRLGSTGFRVEKAVMGN
jgi:hypothetical protein